MKLKSSWPETVFKKGGFTRRQRINMVENERAARARRAAGADMIAEARREIENEKKERQKAASVRHFFLGNPGVKGKVRQLKDGSTAIQPIAKGKFQKAIKIST